MNGLNLTINTDSVSSDALDIDTIVENMQQHLAELEKVIKDNIPSGVDTDWSNELKDDWVNFYNGPVEDGMESLKASAKALRDAVQAALEYNK